MNELGTIFKSWKTTIAGIASIVIGAITVQQNTFHSIPEALGDFRVQMTILVGLIGILSKDSNVSGEK